MFKNPVMIGMAGWLASVFFCFTALSTARAADKKSEGGARLETLLQEWKKADHEIRELHCKFHRIMKHQDWGVVETTQGEIFLKKPDLLRIDSKDEKGKVYSINIYKGKTIRIYDYKNQTETYLNGYADWLSGELFSTFFQTNQWMLSALPFGETERNFDFRLNKEDKYWAYIQLKPRNPRQPLYIDEVEAVLNQETHLVRQIRWWATTSGDTRMTLDFDKVEINPTPPITWETISQDLPHWGKASNQKKPNRNSGGSSSDLEQRMHELINNSEDLPKIKEHWDKTWKEPNSKAERVHGGIQ